MPLTFRKPTVYKIRAFGHAGRLAITPNPTGWLESYALAKDGRVRRFAQDLGDGHWVDAGFLPNAAGLIEIAVGGNADGRLEVFGTDGNTGVWHVWQAGAPGGDFTGGSQIWAPENLKHIAIATN